MCEGRIATYLPTTQSKKEQHNVSFSLTQTLVLGGHLARMLQMVSCVVARYVDALSDPHLSVGVGWSTVVSRGRGNAPPDDQR